MTPDEIQTLISEEIRRIKIVAGHPRREFGNPHKVIDIKLTYDDDVISETEIPYHDGGCC